MSSQRLFTINAEGKLKNVGRGFKSYNYDIVEKCAELFLGEGAESFDIVYRQLGRKRPEYHWDQKTIKVFCRPTPYAHEAILRLMKIADSDTLDGYCFVVTECGKSTTGGLHGVFLSRSKMEEYVAKVPKSVVDDLYVRIVKFDRELS